MIDVAEVNQWRWLEESGQWLENVDRTHLVLAIGKPELQKKIQWSIAVDGLQGGRPPQEAEQAQVQRHLEDGEAQLADEGVREGRQAQRRNGAL